MNATVDGHALDAAAPPGQSLLTWLRAGAHTAPKHGCGTGDCGACTVLLGDTPVHACITPAHRADGKTITTLAGLTDQAWPERWAAAQAFQCGYCTSGFLTTLARMPPDQIDEALKGNLCRCTGYAAIADAVAGHSRLAADGAGPADRHGPNLLSGKSSYTADTVPADALHLAVWRSPWAHARVADIDVTAARAIEGVVRIFTPANTPATRYSSGCHALPELDPADMRMLDPEIRFIGQRVAAVVATSRAAALAGVDALGVQAEVLPAALTPADAARGDVLVHPPTDGLPPNVIAAVETASAAWTAAPEQRTYRTHRAQHTHLEPHITWAQPDADGLHVVTSTQVPFLVRDKLADLLGISNDRIRVTKPRVGGGFGNKQEMLTEDLVAWAAIRLQRPVVWELTRSEEFIATTSRHPMELTTTVGYDTHGAWNRLGLEAIVNTGAYGNHAPGVLHCALFEGLAPYRLEAKRAAGRAYYTHTLPAGAYRGYGGSQGVFAVECTVEELAHAAGQPPLAFRRQHLVRPGDPLFIGAETATAHALNPNALHACLDRVQAWADAAPTAAPPQGSAWSVGTGFAVGLITAGPGPMHRSEATVTWEESGRLIVRSGAADVGTGTDTLLGAIAAEVTGLDPNQIDVVTADTGTTPYDAGSFASATASVAGEAVRQACASLVAQLFGASGPAAWGHPHQRPAADRTAHASFAPAQTSVSFAVQGMRVAVDRETGQIKVLESMSALDAGRVLHPIAARGQVEGAVMMALGWTLWEDLVISEGGAVANPALRRYRIPGWSDRIPMQVHFHEQPDPLGPLGAKAIGELASNVVAPAVANAVRAATGVSFRELPLTPWRVLDGLSP
jgi:putative selenate reductase molybdopterin-binding subunit